MSDPAYDDVVAANVRLHTSMSDDYQSCEPHFRPENVASVERKLLGVDRGPRRQAPAGPGLRHRVHDRHRQAPRGRDPRRGRHPRDARSGRPVRAGADHPARGRHRLLRGRAGHLRRRHRLLVPAPPVRRGADAGDRRARRSSPAGASTPTWSPTPTSGAASPSWSRRGGEYDPIVSARDPVRSAPDDEIEQEFGVSAEDFNRAEWGKSMQGGFTPEDLEGELAGRRLLVGRLLLRVVRRPGPADQRRGPVRGAAHDATPRRWTRSSSAPCRSRAACSSTSGFIATR